MATVVVALGGNAILARGQVGTYAQQAENIERTAVALAGIVEAGWRLVVTHGNGPQVGNLLIQNEEAAEVVPPMPLHVLGAQSQGMLGYMIGQALQHALVAAGRRDPVATVLTQVEVDPADPAFDDPTKPVGPFFTERRARRLMAERSYVMHEDAGRGWRRVVPSPDPKAIAELEVIRRMVDGGTVVVACGGGGVPVVRQGGRVQGVEAVIDKDLASALLATELGAERLLLLTDVQGVALDFGTPRQRFLYRVSADELAGHGQAGQFAAGSMGPKVEAAVRFVRGGGAMAVIGALDGAREALEGRTGTVVLP